MKLPRRSFLHSPANPGLLRAVLRIANARTCATQFWPALLIFMSLIPESAIAQEAGTHGPDPWYKVAAGIIAIPAAGIGVLVSWNIMRKTRLETRKLEIEIAEKQNAISKQNSPAEKLELLASPLSNSQLALLIIIRFVLLDITLRLWNFVPAAVSLISQAALFSFVLFFGTNTLGELQQSSIIVIGAVPTVIKAILDIVYWTIVFGFGWPLFKDTCAFLNIPIKSLFDVPRIGWTRPD